MPIEQIISGLRIIRMTLTDECQKFYINQAIVNLELLLEYSEKNKSPLDLSKDYEITIRCDFSQMEKVKELVKECNGEIKSADIVSGGLTFQADVSDEELERILGLFKEVSE